MSEVVENRLLKVAEVIHMTAISRSEIYRRLDAGTFPPPVLIGTGVRWRLSDIARWIDALPVQAPKRVVVR